MSLINTLKTMVLDKLCTYFVEVPVIPNDDHDDHDPGYPDHPDS